MTANDLVQVNPLRSLMQLVLDLIYPCKLAVKVWEGGATAVVVVRLVVASLYVNSLVGTD